MDLRRMAIFIEAHTLQTEVLWEEQHLIGIQGQGGSQEVRNKQNTSLFISFERRRATTSAPLSKAKHFKKYDLKLKGKKESNPEIKAESGECQYFTLIKALPSSK